MDEVIEKPPWKIRLEEILNIDKPKENPLENISKRNNLSNEIHLNQTTKDKIARILEEESQKYEAQMPNVEIGAVCSGYFLCKRGFHTLANNYFIKPENCKTYIFKAIEELRNQTISAVNIHPFYELISIITENKP